MAKNIDFMGAVFPDVPSVKLPQQGGGLVAFDDTTDATATADKILQGYTAYANGQKLVGTASGGGGASNYVTGTFTTQSESGIQTIDIPYTGTGYPLVVVVEIDGGTHNPNITDWYDLIHRYAIGSWVAIRNNLSSTPTQYGTVFDVHKSSTSSATSYGTAQNVNTSVFTTQNPSSTTSQVWQAIKVTATTFKVYVSATGAGLAPNLTYRYHIVYSS